MWIRVPRSLHSQKQSIVSHTRSNNNMRQQDHLAAALFQRVKPPRVRKTTKTTTTPKRPSPPLEEEEGEEPLEKIEVWQSETPAAAAPDKRSVLRVSKSLLDDEESTMYESTTTLSTTRISLETRDVEDTYDAKSLEDMTWIQDDVALSFSRLSKSIQRAFRSPHRRKRQFPLQDKTTPQAPQAHYMVDCLDEDLVPGMAASSSLDDVPEIPIIKSVLSAEIHFEDLLCPLAVHCPMATRSAVEQKSTPPSVFDDAWKAPWMVDDTDLTVVWSTSSSSSTDPSVELSLPATVVVQNDGSQVPNILPGYCMKELVSFMPPTLKHRAWQRLFSIGRDGDSFESFLHKVQGHTHTLLVVQSTEGDIFGGFADAQWFLSQTQDSRFVGTGTSFLFKLDLEDDNDQVYEDDEEEEKGTLRVFRWQGINDYNQICCRRLRGLGMGGGGEQGMYGLYIHDDFSCGTSGPCDTYGNTTTLPSREYFHVLNFEVYGFVYATRFPSSPPPPPPLLTR